MATRAQVRTPELRTARKSGRAANPRWVGSSAGNGDAKPEGNGLGLRFTAEELILLRSLATGNTTKQMAGQSRLPRESLF